MKALDHTGKIAVNDTVQALDNRATAEIERMTTDTARAVADFLYHRDADILFAATLPPDEALYRNFTAQKLGRLVKPGQWELAANGRSWQRASPPPPRRGSPPPLRKTTTASTTGRPMALNVNPAPCILK